MGKVRHRKVKQFTKATECISGRAVNRPPKFWGLLLAPSTGLHYLPYDATGALDISLQNTSTFLLSVTLNLSLPKFTYQPQNELFFMGYNICQFVIKSPSFKTFDSCWCLSKYLSG